MSAETRTVWSRRFSLATKPCISTNMFLLTDSEQSLSSCSCLKVVKLIRTRLAIQRKNENKHTDLDIMLGLNGNINRKGSALWGMFTCSVLTLHVKPSEQKSVPRPSRCAAPFTRQLVEVCSCLVLCSHCLNDGRKAQSWRQTRMIVSSRDPNIITVLLWLRLTLSNGPNWRTYPPIFHLRMEKDTVSETFF